MGIGLGDRKNVFIYREAGGSLHSRDLQYKGSSPVLSHKAHRVSCLDFRKSVPRCENPTVVGKVARVGLTVLSAWALLTRLQQLWGEPGRDGGLLPGGAL